MHHETKKEDTAAFTAIPFGNIQPFLDRNTTGETIVRIYSMIEYDSKVIFKYTKHIGNQEYIHKGVFNKTNLTAYKSDSRRNCFEKVSLADGAWRTKCDTRGCTRVLDTDYVQHTSGSYQLMPNVEYELQTMFYS